MGAVMGAAAMDGLRIVHGQELLTLYQSEYWLFDTATPSVEPVM
jgi:hypothetical protein